MDIREVRRKNLAALREQQGSLRAIADLVDTDANYLSQILGGHGKHYMGHAMARRIEAALKKREGWMDQPHDLLEPEDESVNNIYKLAKILTPAQRKSLELLMQSMVPLSIQDQDLKRRTG